MVSINAAARAKSFWLRESQRTHNPGSFGSFAKHQLLEQPFRRLVSAIKLKSYYKPLRMTLAERRWSENKQGVACCSYTLCRQGLVIIKPDAFGI